MSDDEIKKIKKAIHILKREHLKIWKKDINESIGADGKVRKSVTIYSDLDTIDQLIGPEQD